MADDLTAQYENALKWISFWAYNHYIGNAFDPEHMGAIADVAEQALAGEFHETNFDEAMAAAKVRATELVAALNQRVDEAWGH